MDAVEKKFIVQLDSPVESVWHMVLRQLQQHHENTGRSWRGLVADWERLESDLADAADDCERLLKENARLEAANKKWQQYYFSLQAVTSRLRTLREWISWHRSRVITVSAVLAIGAVVWNFYGPGTGAAAVAAREATERDFRGLAASWPWGQGETEPQVYSIQRHNWWVVAVGDAVLDSHADQYGKDVEMHCIHLYAKPAVSDFGAYLKPAARHWAMGLFSWPEVATDCKVAATRKANQ